MDKIQSVSLILGICLALDVAALPPRDYVSVVGSSTAFPFAATVAERFGKTTEFRAPRVESVGSGAGIRLFCKHVGPESPDVALASRKMTASEIKMCQDNGVNSVTEIIFGYDGITVANSREAPHLDLTLKDLFIALAREVPNPNNTQELIPNPYKTWKAVNPKLPETEILVYGPPPTSGTRDVFVQLALEKGCESFESISAIKNSQKSTFRQICHGLREDGAYVDSGENDNLIVKKLLADPQAVGVFGFNFYERNQDRLQAAGVAGSEPTWQNIFDHSYPLSRPLFLFVKNAHVDAIPGVKAFLLEFVSTNAVGEDGYLSDKGLIPLHADEIRALSKTVSALE